MAKPRTPRLKVFEAQLGFFDSVVAAPSKAAALAAWGTHQDLFATGDARIATDEAAVKAALEHPETPLQRAVGTKDAFRLEPRAPPSGGFKSSAERKAAKPRPNRTRLDPAEAALQRLDADHEREQAELQKLQDELDQRRTAAREAYVVARKAAAAAVSKARAAYRAAGGKP